MGVMGDGRTPNLLGSGGGMARESLRWGFGPTAGLAVGGRAVTSLSLVKPGRCDVGNFMPGAGGRNGEVQVGLGRTTVVPFEGFEW